MITTMKVLLPLMLATTATATAVHRPDAKRATAGDTAVEARSEKRGGGRMKKLDRDGDGVVSRDEFLQRANHRFDRIDADDDNQITRQELMKAKKDRNHKRGKRKGHHKSKLKALDVDGSKSLSREEVAGHRLARHFDKLDVDGNGELTMRELRSSKAATNRKGKGKSKRNKAEKRETKSKRGQGGKDKARSKGHNKR